MLCAGSGELGGTQRKDMLEFNLHMSLPLVLVLFFKVFKVYSIVVVGAVLEILLAPPLM